MSSDDEEQERCNLAADAAADEYYNQLERDKLEEKIKSLEFEIEQFKSGVNTFKCVACGAFTGSFLNVNLFAEIKALEEEIERLNDGR